MSIERTKLIIASQQKKYPGYLTFWSTNSFVVGCYDSDAVRFKIGWDGTMEYSTDKINWSVWSDGAMIQSAQSGDKYYLYLRGTNNTRVTGPTGDYVYPIYKSDLSALCPDIHITGSIETLLDYKQVLKGLHPVMGERAFRGMFVGVEGIVEAPDLPAITLTKMCYNGMFHNCKNLLHAPELPATTIATQCYTGMFQYCESLITAPSILPAKTMYPDCYFGMFQGCTSLTRAPSLPATNLATQCYITMFEGCTSLTQIPELPATSLTHQCYVYMFKNCSSLKFSETQTAECPNPYRIPIEGTGTVGTQSLHEMFQNTGGTFTGTPSINTTYYTNATIV